MIKQTAKSSGGMTLPLILTAVLLPASGPVRSGEAGVPGMPLDCDPAVLDYPLAKLCEVARRKEGKRLFTEETFGGNGRSCQTCHSEETGTFNPEEALSRFLSNPSDPLFLHDGLDDGTSDVSRILEHATVRITLPLPDGVWLKDDPTTTEVTFNRGTPTTRNTPALDPLLMYDIRNIDLQEQALGAIQGHAQNTIEPTPLELDLIAEFQQTASRFFSDTDLQRFAEGGAAPQLPAGVTESEIRGRRFFVDAEFDPPSKDGICALCHSGPMLDTANKFSTAVFGNPPFSRIHNVGVSERNPLNNPEYTFVIQDLQGTLEVTTPDLGLLVTDYDRLLTQSDIPSEPLLVLLGLRKAFFANFFKIPTLWGVKDTAPYFHDNSAKDLDELLQQYDFFFANSPRTRGKIALTPQDFEDIKAFLKLL